MSRFDGAHGGKMMVDSAALERLAEKKPWVKAASKRPYVPKFHGWALKRYRKRVGLSRTELALLVSRHPEYIRRLERSGWQPPLEVALDLALVLGVTLDDLVYYVPVPLKLRRLKRTDSQPAL